MFGSKHFNRWAASRTRNFNYHMVESACPWTKWCHRLCGGCKLWPFGRVCTARPAIMQRLAGHRSLATLVRKARVINVLRSSVLHFRVWNRIRKPVRCISHSWPIERNLSKRHPAWDVMFYGSLSDVWVIYSVLVTGVLPVLLQAGTASNGFRLRRNLTLIGFCHWWSEGDNCVPVSLEQLFFMFVLSCHTCI